MSGCSGVLAALAARLASSGTCYSAFTAFRSFSTSLAAEIRREPASVKPTDGMPLYTPVNRTVIDCSRVELLILNALTGSQLL